MTALFSRTSLPCRLILSRAIGPVRQCQWQWQWQCSPSGHDDFPLALRAARPATSTTDASAYPPAARLFHSSSATALKKPSSAVFKPTSKSRTTPSISRQTSSPKIFPPSKTSPLRTSTPRTSPPKSPSHSPIISPSTSDSPLTSSSTPSSSTKTASPTPSSSIKSASSTPSSSSKTASFTPSLSIKTTPTTPFFPPNQARPSYPSYPSYHAPKTELSANYQIMEELARAPGPTVLYEAPSQAPFILVCLTSTVFLAVIMNFTWNNYKPAVDQGNSIIAAVGVLNCAIFFFLAWYFAVGPNSLVKRLVAIPAKPTRTPGANLRPTLRIEPVRYGFGRWYTPTEVDLKTVFSDRSIAHEIEKITVTRRPSRFMQQFFPWVVKAWSAYLTMFARATRLTYIRAGNANFKLDLDGCRTHDGGKLLDHLIKVDSTPANFFKRVFGN